LASSVDVSAAELGAHHDSSARVVGSRQVHWFRWHDGSLAVYDDANAQTHLLSERAGSIFLASLQSAAGLQLAELARELGDTSAADIQDVVDQLARLGLVTIVA
jgi:hypothetical protein